MAPCSAIAAAHRPPSAASRLSLPQLAGKRLVAGFQGTDGAGATAADDPSGGLAGVILFAENLPEPGGGACLIAEIESIRRPPGLRDPLLVMVDQEGGLVKRLAGAPTASAAQMGAAGAAFSREQGRATAANLRGVGVNVDLAPVLDVARPGGTIAATERGFGSTAAAVEATAVPFAVGLAGPAASLPPPSTSPASARRPKTPTSPCSGSTCRSGRCARSTSAPYRRFIAAGGELVMLSTAIYPAFSPRPAAFARPIATGELRRRIGFDGVSITDALESAAVRDFGGPAAAARAASAAGTDLLLFTDYRAAMAAGRALLRLTAQRTERPRRLRSLGRPGPAPAPLLGASAARRR